MKIRKYREALLEGARNITESSVKLGSGQTQVSFRIRSMEHGNLGRWRLTGSRHGAPNTAHIDPESLKNTHLIHLFVISDN